MYQTTQLYRAILVFSVTFLLAVLLLNALTPGPVPGEWVGAEDEVFVYPDGRRESLKTRYYCVFLRLLPRRDQPALFTESSWTDYPPPPKGCIRLRRYTRKRLFYQ